MSQIAKPRFLFVLPSVNNFGEPDIAKALIRPANLGAEEEVHDQGIDFSGSTMGRIVRWRIVSRGDRQFYQSVFRTEPDEIRNLFRMVPRDLLESTLAENIRFGNGTCELVLERPSQSQKAPTPSLAQGANEPQVIEWAKHTGANRAAANMQLPQSGKSLRLIITVTQQDQNAYAVSPAIVPKEVFERDAKVLSAGFDNSSLELHRPVLWRTGERGGQTVCWSSFPARLSEVKMLFAQSPEAELRSALRERPHTYRAEPEMEMTIEALPERRLEEEEATTFGCLAECAVAKFLGAAKPQINP